MEKPAESAGRKRKMKKIFVKDKARIKELLYDGYMVGIKGSKFGSFGGFQRWQYDKHADTCHSCDAVWADKRRIIKSYSLKKATKILWHNRGDLYLYAKNISEKQKQKINDLFLPSKK